jgi:hypothetical protein
MLTGKFDVPWQKRNWHECVIRLLGLNRNAFI